MAAAQRARWAGKRGTGAATASVAWQVAASITDPDSPYRYLEIRGIAEIEDDPDKTFIDEMSRKYIGKDYPWNQPGDERVIVKIRPEHATGQG